MNTKREADSGLVSTEANEPQIRPTVALGEESCEVVKLDYVDLEKARGEYGRLRLWGGQSKPTLPARPRGSLDDTLRHDQSLKGKVADMLLLPIHQLNMGMKCLL